MKHRAMYIFAVCVCVAAVIFAVYMILSDTDTELDTVKHESFDASVCGSGLVYTDCVLLSTERGSVVLPLCGDGELVKADQPVALTYIGESESLKTIGESAERLRMLTEANISADSMTLEQADGMISELTSRIYSYKDGGDAETLQRLQRELYILYRKRDIITSKKQNYDDEIEALWDKIKSVTAVFGVTVKQINSPCDGYYYSQAYSADAVLSSRSIDELTFDGFADTDISDISDVGYAGKILKSPRWYFAIQAEKTDVPLFTVGQTYKFTVDRAEKQTDAVFYRAVYGSGNDCILIFSCNTASEYSVFKPTGYFDVICSELQGVTVSADAIYFKDGVQGVYVLKDGVLNFMPVDIIYSENSTHMVQPSNGQSLEPYDRVAVGDKDIYDGKIID